MTDLTQLAPHEILARIENRNRRFKLASTIFGGVLLAGLVVILVIGLQTLQGVDSQLSSQKRLLNSQRQILDNIKTGSDDNATHVKDLQNHIDCIVELLRQPNRQNLTIRDLNGCQFDSNGNIITPSGGSNVPQKNTTTNPNNNSGGTANSTSPSQQPNQPPASTKTGAVQGTLNNLFCPLKLTNLTCSN